MQMSVEAFAAHIIEYTDSALPKCAELLMVTLALNK